MFGLIFLMSYAIYYIVESLAFVVGMGIEKYFLGESEYQKPIIFSVMVAGIASMWFFHKYLEHNVLNAEKKS
jgi:hypothetical protein